MTLAIMSELKPVKWSRFGKALYKYRELNSWCIDIITSQSLYFGAIKNMRDPMELAINLIISENSASIADHLNGYLSVLIDNLSFEKELLSKAALKYHDDIAAPFIVSRRNFRVMQFDERVKYANQLQKDVLSSDGRTAASMLHSFYECIRKSFFEASICCLTKTPTVPKMWEDYADNHRGVCFEFSDNLFKNDKKVTRFDVIYKHNADIDPIDIGYMDTYNSFFSHKHSSYSQEDEVRFFIFGDQRPIKIKSSHLRSVLLGKDFFEPLPNADAERMRVQNILLLSEALIQRNEARNPEHKTNLQLAIWKGYELFTAEIDPLIILDGYKSWTGS